MKINLLKGIFLIIAIFIIIITLFSLVSASPILSENEIDIHVKENTFTTGSFILSDDEFTQNPTILEIIPNSNFQDSSSHIRNLQIVKIDQYAQLVTFEVYIPSGTDTGFYREIIKIDDSLKFNVGVHIDNPIVYYFYDVFNKEFSIFGWYTNSITLILILIALIFLICIIYLMGSIL